VALTLDTPDLCDGEFVGVWMFNVDPALANDLGDLQICLVSAGCEGTFDSPNVFVGANAHKADGDGYFDIKIEFSDEDGDITHRFNAGDTAKFAISGIGSLTASSFDFISEPNGGPGEHFTAAHIQGIGNDSGWICTPEPAFLAFLSVGVLAMLRGKR